MSQATATAPTANLTQIAQVVALGTVIKGKALTEAKGKLPEQFAQQVDFTARIRAMVTKGVGEPGASGSNPATCDLFTRNIVSEVFRRLKVTPARLRQLIRAATADNGHAVQYVNEPDNAALIAVFEEVAADVAKTLPDVPWRNDGRAAAVRCEGSYEII